MCYKWTENHNNYLFNLTFNIISVTCLNNTSDNVLIAEESTIILVVLKSNYQKKQRVIQKIISNFIKEN